MNYKIYTLAWTNNDPRMIEAHKKVFEFFNLPINYTFENIHHGVWMDQIFHTSDAEILVFFDFDCVPLSKEAVEEAISLAQNGYLVGNAGITNCIKAKHDYFCAPSFLAISKKYYEEIGKPSCVNCEIKKSDIAQNLTRAAIEKEKRLKTYFPTSFQTTSESNGIWRLSGYGYFGIGTIFDEKFYHLAQGRMSYNVNLFVETCNYIINGQNEKINRKYDSKKEWMNILHVDDEYGL